MNNIELYHVKQSANKAAHQLARESYNYPGRSFDRDSIPVLLNIVLSWIYCMNKNSQLFVKKIVDMRKVTCRSGKVG